MKTFVLNHAEDVIGVLSGFDRLVFRGTIRQLAHLDGLESYLATMHVLLKDFGRHALAKSTQIKEAVQGAVEKLGRPVVYLPSSQTSKEQTARAIAERDGVRDGTICLLTCVEPCKTFEVHGDRATRRIHLKPALRKCLFLYRYAFHPVFGFTHVRIQSWFPFTVRLYLNGREWLAREMDRLGLGYRRRENCFVWLSDPTRAQRLMDEQLRHRWPEALDAAVRDLNPAYPAMFGRFVAPYYWSVDQSEWATDIMFRSPDALARLYPRLVRHGISAFSSPDVMRFLGQSVPSHGRVNGNFLGEIVSDLKHRPEGVRIKHRLNSNSIKLYDKQGSVLRIETTIVNARDLKVFRPREGDPHGKRAWRRLRNGVADLFRRTRLSQAANERYAEALAAIDAPLRFGEIVDRLARPAEIHGRRVRGLRLWDPGDLALLRAVNRGEFVITGLRNRDLRALLHSERPPDAAEDRRRSTRTGRLLRLLRAHRILRKVPKTHRYLVTPFGRRTIAALLAANDATVEQLTRKAA